MATRPNLWQLLLSLQAPPEAVARIMERMQPQRPLIGKPNRLGQALMQPRLPFTPAQRRR